ncbi:hypothetical protein H4R99_008091 [Coemansia sp. RSA 1722]|nr:hypothetical protein H4R99_008091 [Coemansia sp. RSA 1722]
MAAVVRSQDYAAANNDYAAANNDYGVAANNDYGVAANNDYGVAANNDYGVAANDDYAAGGDGGDNYDTSTSCEDDETTTVVIEGSSPCEPVVTPEIQTLIEDVVNTVLQYSTVVVQQTQVEEVTQQITNIQIQSVAAQQDALYQVTQTYICPPPPTVTVNNVNAVWVTETATPTVQVVQTRIQPQVVVQPVTLTQQVQQVDVQTQVIQEEATAVVTTSVHNMVQVVQENVGQQQIPNAGAYAPIAYNAPVGYATAGPVY